MKTKEKTVWINGTERSVGEKDKYGIYHIFLDDKDIKWLDKIKVKQKCVK